AEVDHIRQRLRRKIDHQDLVVGPLVVAVDAVAVERHECQPPVVTDGQLMRRRLRCREALHLAQRLRIIEADEVADLVDGDEPGGAGDVAAGVGSGHRMLRCAQNPYSRAGLSTSSRRCASAVSAKAGTKSTRSASSTAILRLGCGKSVPHSTLSGIAAMMRA